MTSTLLVKFGLAVALIASAGSAARAQEARAVTIALGSAGLVAAGPRIADEMHLFDARGIDPEFVVTESANAAMAALLSGSVDAVVSGPGEMVLAKARGQDVVVLANAYAGVGGSLVLAKSVADRLGVSPEAPIEERLRALDGLIIGSTTPTSSYTIAFRGATDAVGAHLNSTYMSMPTMKAALDRGAIQGFIASAPYWAAPVLDGSGVVWISGPKGDLPAEHRPVSSVTIQTTRSFAEGNSQTVADIAATMADFAKAIDERPDEFRAAVRRVFPNLDDQTLALLLESEANAWKGGTLTVEDMKREIAFVRSGGAPIPNPDALDPASFLLP